MTTKQQQVSKIIAQDITRNLREIARRHGIKNGDIAKQMGRKGKNANAKISLCLAKGKVNFSTFCNLCDAIAELSGEGLDFNEVFGVKPVSRAKK